MIGGSISLANAAHEPWPLGLGPLDTLATRFPYVAKSASAASFEQLAASSFDKESYNKIKTALMDYETREIENPSLAVAPPPADVAEYLTSRRAAIENLRTLLEQQQLEFKVDTSKGLDVELPNLLTIINTARALAVDALMTSRTDGPGAWRDLHAAHSLAESVWRRPEMISRLIAFSIDRLTNAVARKLPPPAPPWLADIAGRDYQRAMVEGMQFETYAMWTGLEKSLFTDEDNPSLPVRLMRKMFRTLIAPYLRFAAADYIHAFRAAAADFAATSACDFDGPAWDRRSLSRVANWDKVGQIALPNFGMALQRALRFRAEVELTQNLFAVRSGALQLPAPSRCPEGRWIAQPSGLKFSGTIRPDQRIHYVVPLEARWQ